MAAIPRPEPEDWLKASARQMKAGDREVLAMLKDSYKEVQSILKTLPKDEGSPFGSLIARAQYERVRRELLNEQASTFRRLGDLVSARRLEAAGRAAELSAASDAALLRLVGKSSVAQQLLDGAAAAAKAGLTLALARLSGASYVPLAERIYKAEAWMNGRLDKLINAQLAIGINAQRFAKAARDWFSPSTPGGVRYAALRLARTEINNAFHATSLMKYQDKPWVDKVAWNLSGSHVVPDECNEYAKASPFPKNAVPRKPHPQCMCYVTEETPDEDEWIDRFVAGEFDEYLDGELAKQPGFAAEKRTEKKVVKPAPTKPKPAASTPPPTPAPAPRAPTYDERLSAAAKEEDALNAPLIGLGRPAAERPPFFTRILAEAISYYTGSYYKEINGYLRTGSKAELGEGIDVDGRPTLGNVEGWIKGLDEAMERSPVSKDLVTYRGMLKGETLFGDRLKGDLTGFEWKEEAYVSTATVQKRTQAFMTGSSAGRVNLRILVPRGSRAIQGSPIGAEAEVLLNRGTNLKVVRDNGIGPDGIRYLDVEAVDEALGSVEGAAERGLPAADRQRADDPGTRPEVVPAEGERRLSGPAAREVVPKGLFKRGTLTPVQRKAVKLYETGWSMVINGRLRRNAPVEDKYDQKEVDTVTAIDSAMEASVIPEPIQTWRGMFNAGALFGDRLDGGDMTGFSWNELAYSSTTTDEKITDLFMVKDENAVIPGKNVKLIVNIPAGIQGLEVSTDTKGSEANGAQSEIVLQRNLRWTVTKDYGKHPDGYRLLEVSVIPL